MGGDIARQTTWWMSLRVALKECIAHCGVMSLHIRIFISWLTVCDLINCRQFDPHSKMSEVTLYNSMREKLLKDEVAYTLSVKLVRSVELPMMAKTAGFDGILIDMEHSSFDLDTTSRLTFLLAHVDGTDKDLRVNCAWQHFT